MNIGAALVQTTNLILQLRNLETDKRKFVVWQKTNNKLVEILEGLEITRIPLEDGAKVFEHPIETGVVITDVSVFEPKKAVIHAYISNDDNTTLEELYQLYYSGTELVIRVGNKIIDNELELKSFRKLANTILKIQDNNHIYSKNENEYVYYQCKTFLETHGKNDKVNRINSLYAMSRSLIVSLPLCLIVFYM